MSKPTYPHYPGQIFGRDDGATDGIDEPFVLMVVPPSMASGVSAIVKELVRAMEKFPNNSVFRSRHEGYGVLLEEVDELWDAIKNNDHGTGKSQDAAEAVQVGAMALHYLKDFGGGNG